MISLALFNLLLESQSEQWCLMSTLIEHSFNRFNTVRQTPVSVKFIKIICVIHKEDINRSSYRTISQTDDMWIIGELK